MDKQNQRQKLIALRKTVPSVSTGNEIRFLDTCVQWNDVSNVHIYRHNPRLNEYKTTTILKWIQNNYPHIGIKQPDTHMHATMHTDVFDVVIVPVVGFDKSGNRIGMGGGWYDKFLAMHPNALKVGLAYDECELQKIEPEPHDVRLDYIITPTRLIDTHQLQ